MIHIISDVHGCYHTLVKLIEKVKDADEHAQFVFVGDYVDRGLYNKESVEYIINMKKDGAICLRGNHDNTIDYMLNEHYLGNIQNMIVGPPSMSKVYEWWMYNGLSSTLDSYGVTGHIKGNSGSDVVKEFQDKVPQEHKDFLRELPLFWENATHFSCHAYYRIDEELPRMMKFLNLTPDLIDEILWSRFTSFKETKWDKIGVFGHTPTSYYGYSTPIKFDKIRLIDTGVIRDNYLCAYCVESDDWILQSTDNKDI